MEAEANATEELEGLAAARTTPAQQEPAQQTRVTTEALEQDWGQRHPAAVEQEQLVSHPETQQAETAVMAFLRASLAAALLEQGEVAAPPTTLEEHKAPAAPAAAATAQHQPFRQLQVLPTLAAAVEDQQPEAANQVAS